MCSSDVSLWHSSSHVLEFFSNFCVIVILTLLSLLLRLSMLGSLLPNIDSSLSLWQGGD